MPVSTRQPSALAGQQTKLNFATKKNTSHQKIIAHDIPHHAPTPSSTISGELEGPIREHTGVSGQDSKAGKIEHVEQKEEADTSVEGSRVVVHKVVETQELEATRYQEQVAKKPEIILAGVSEELSDEVSQITPKQIKSYYKNIENSRICAPVHQAGLTEYEKILRHFDLSSQYGPCVGVTRFKRWSRAERLGLEPPLEVLAVMLKSELGEAIDALPRDWVVSPLASREDVGSVAYINELLATHTE